MLVVIMLVAVLSSLAVANLSNVRQSSIEAQRKRNAQEIAAVFATGVVAGADFLVAGDKRATAENVLNGVAPDSGVFSGKIFRAGIIGAEALDGALSYLDLEGEMLVYKSAGVP